MILSILPPMGKPFKWIEPSEKEIENAILEFLNYQVGVFAFKVNTMGVYDQRGGFYRKLSKHVIPGTPDVIACVDGLFAGFEIKTKTGRQSNEQKLFQEKLISKSNGLYFIVRSVKDAEQALASVRGNKEHVYTQITHPNPWERVEDC
jgi:hypothetical protein